MKLRYVGPAPSPDAVLPLPEGWPAYDHEETQQSEIDAKIASGFYRAVARSKGGVSNASDSQSAEIHGRAGSDEGNAPGSDKNSAR